MVTDDDDWDDLWTAEPVAGQVALFGADEQFSDAWRNWGGMPDFQMEDQEPVDRVIVQFATMEDRAAFGDLIGQPITRHVADAIWWPKRDVAHWWDKRYRDATDDDRTETMK